ncbi:hypothetical protein CBF34_07220 [Vagococcus penaei]|uniref:DUF6414 family protein n=1 Tax=Vagococcus penaei TaxID=633807 RepID=UPI000F88BB59|nr:hypothetical protein [Vagococcus penaei]RSU01439.1 hypothetical protein CBF34_07220 [Vagococcus penaei]
MKEYIYLDEDALNSILSQTDGGLLSAFSKSKEQGSVRSESSTENTERGIDGPWILGAKYLKEFSNESGIELTKNQQKTLDYVLSDHAVDYLLDKLNSFSNFKTDITKTNEGDIVYFQTEFSLYDFSLIKEITSPENTIMFTDLDEKEKKQIEKLKKDIKTWRGQVKKHPEIKKEIDKAESQIKEFENRLNNFSMIHQAANFSENILGGSLLIKSNSSVSLCKKEAFRLNKGQLAMLVDSKRKIKIFGTVIANKNKIHKDGEFGEFKSDEMNKIPAMFTEIFLSNFGMINEGDKIIKPIALFFE